MKSPSGRPSWQKIADGTRQPDDVTPASLGGERAEHHADRGIPAGGQRQELPCGVCG
ncbi:hypothetical protein [Escherichia coli]|uniref:hypothetical protein n=1 Tax=Escherichia coli TaxID=562 RepID=UPI003F74BFFC